MPAFPDMTSADVDDVIAYLKHPENSHIPPDILARLVNPPPPSPRLAPAGTRYWTGYGYMNSSDGLPAISPPWSTLTAYDLNTGSIKWHIPFGEVSSLAEKGIHGTGSFWPRGGVVVTAGGLIFGGSISDNTMRAYDKDTGKVLWEMKLPLVLRAYRQFTKWPEKSTSSSVRARRLAHLQRLVASLLRRWRRARQASPGAAANGLRLRSTHRGTMFLRCRTRTDRPEAREKPKARASLRCPGFAILGIAFKRGKGAYLPTQPPST